MKKGRNFDRCPMAPGGFRPFFFRFPRLKKLKKRLEKGGDVGYNGCRW